jgi:hypothetical protein
MESRLVTEGLGRIAAIVEFDTPPTLDNLQRLLGIISEESKIYNVLKIHLHLHFLTAKNNRNLTLNYNY